MAKDMRSWIKQLDENGELIKINEEVDPKADMSAFFCQSKEKALLFEHVKGHPGWKVLGQAPGNMRNAGLAFGTEFRKITTEFVRRLNRGTIPCKTVNGGPVKDTVFTGSDVQITKFPAHIQGQKDAGPYITSGLCIIKDPETGIRNMSFHRLQIKGDHKLGIMMVPGRHTWMIYQKYRALGKAMPMAIMIGHHPMYYMAAAYTGALDLDELELAGALLEEPVSVTKCETIDIEAPADAEIILEGELPPDIREPEGPFSEFQGYYFGGVGENPIVNIKAITMRSDAIYKGLQNGADVEGCIYHRIPMSAALYNDLKNVTGHIDLKDVYCHWGTIFGIVIQLTPRFYGEAKSVLLASLSSIYLHQKIAVAVDEDVDIYDPADVAWAITTRVDPINDVHIIPGLRGHQLDEAVTEQLEEPRVSTRQKVTSKMLIDATKPPVSDPDRRSKFERIEPIGLDRVPEDFLGK